MQIPSTGLPASAASRTTGTIPRRVTSSIVAAKAPSPGRTSASAARKTAGSPVSVVSAPAWRKALVTLPRLPIP
jgi:hypothetical protein